MSKGLSMRRLAVVLNCFSRRARVCWEQISWAVGVGGWALILMVFDPCLTRALVVARQAARSISMHNLPLLIHLRSIPSHAMAATLPPPVSTVASSGNNQRATEDLSPLSGLLFTTLNCTLLSELPHRWPLKRNLWENLQSWFFPFVLLKWTYNQHSVYLGRTSVFATHVASPTSHTIDFNSCIALH